jgi:hypothetical protein
LIGNIRALERLLEYALFQGVAGLRGLQALGRPTTRLYGGREVRAAEWPPEFQDLRIVALRLGWRAHTK